MKFIVFFLLSAFIRSAGAGDWPHWRGPSRNDIVDEASGWQDGHWVSPSPRWTARVGEGASSPLVAGDLLYTAGWANGSDSIFCLGAGSGKVLWKKSYRSPRYGRNATGDQGLYSGISSTPEYDPTSSYLYTLSADGDLNCWDAGRQGQRVWRVNLYERYKMPQRPRVGRSGPRDYGYTSAPMVYEDWLLVEAGGNAGTLVALDKRTGAHCWGSEAAHLAGHAGGLSPMAIEGVPCIAMLTHSHLLVVRLDRGREGQTVAEYPWETFYANSIACPAVEGNQVLITSGYNHKAILKLAISLKSVRKVWEQPFVSKVCPPVIHQGRVYFAWRRLRCLDLESGKQLWQGPAPGDAGSCIITSDNRLIVWSGRGDLVLAETAARSPSAYHELARIPGLSNTDVWPHVVLARRRLYCKDRKGVLKCFLLPAR